MQIRSYNDLCTYAFNTPMNYLSMPITRGGKKYLYIDIKRNACDIRACNGNTKAKNERLPARLIHSGCLVSGTPFPTASASRICRSGHLSSQCFTWERIQ